MCSVYLEENLLITNFKLSLTRLLFILGIFLSSAWLFFYGQPTLILIYQNLNNEPYYFDVIPFYLLTYSVAPFFLSSYIIGVKQTSTNRKLVARQWVNFITLTIFALIQLAFCLAFFYSFFSTFTVFEFTVEWLLIMLPIVFLSFFLCLIKFLFQTRGSLAFNNKVFLSI